LLAAVSATDSTNNDAPAEITALERALPEHFKQHPDATIWPELRQAQAA